MAERDGTSSALASALALLASAAAVLGCSAESESSGTTAAARSKPACVRALQVPARELGSLHSRLKVGLNVGDYTTRVGDVRVAYDEVVPHVGPCDAASRHIDTAITLHSDAAAAWVAVHQ